MKLSPYIRLLRPSHWVKNVFVFLPLFFSQKILQFNLLINVGYSFVIFCFIASSIYILNDLKDLPYDKKHLTKKNRPIAAGLIVPQSALWVSILLMLLSLILSFLLSTHLFIVILGYYFLNLAYTYGLKTIPIVDLLCISLGFVLRLLAGAVVTGVILSKWILLLTLLLSLFLAIGKRKEDLAHFVKSGELLRSSIQGYSNSFINTSMVSLSILIVVTYLAYVFSSEIINQLGTDKIYVTSFWVVLGFLRYFQLIFKQKKGGDPTKLLLQDYILQIILLLWISTFFVLIY